MALSRRPTARRSYRSSVFNFRKAPRSATTKATVADERCRGGGGSGGDKALLFLCIAMRSLISPVAKRHAPSRGCQFGYWVQQAVLKTPDLSKIAFGARGGAGEAQACRRPVSAPAIVCASASTRLARSPVTGPCAARPWRYELRLCPFLTGFRAGASAFFRVTAVGRDLPFGGHV